MYRKIEREKHRQKKKEGEVAAARNVRQWQVRTDLLIRKTSLSAGVLFQHIMSITNKGMLKRTPINPRKDQKISFGARIIKMK